MSLDRVESSDRVFYRGKGIEDWGLGSGIGDQGLEIGDRTEIDVQV